MKTIRSASSPAPTPMLAAALPLVLPLLLAPPSRAQDLDFTNGCENRSSTAERAIIEAAYEFVWEHRYDLWNEIDRRRAAGNAEGYESVSDTRRERWLREIEHVTMNCEISGCGSNSSLYGHCGVSGAGGGVLNPFDSTAVCIDNLQALATSCGNTSAIAYVAGTLAHEVMHQCDGWEGHPSGGTVATNPQTDAETVGIAMEHMALTPDLEVEILTMKQKVASSGTAYLEVVVQIRNTNELSGPTTAVGRSGRSRQATTSLGVWLNGAYCKAVSVAPLAGGDSREQTITVTTSEGYRATTASWSVCVIADRNDTLTEYDEADNDDTETFDPDCDLAITRFEIAGPYSTTATLSGSVRRLTYAVEVANQSTVNQSPATVLRQVGPSLVGGVLVGSRTQDSTLPALAPGGTATFSIVADVLVSSAPIWGTLWLGVDPDVTLRDEQRTNNEQSVVFTANYFRPDYVCWFTDLALAESGGVLAGFTVKNMGPVTGGSCHARLVPSCGTAVRRSISGLAAAASASYQFEITDAIILRGTTATFDLTVDWTGLVAENDEGNNVASAWLRNGQAVDEIPLIWELLPEYEQPLWIDTHRYADVEDALLLADRYLWTHGRYTSSGPIIERPSTFFLATDMGTFLLSFVAPQRYLPTFTVASATRFARYESLRMTGSSGPIGQSLWR